jgi:hypothetical protein
MMHALSNDELRRFAPSIFATEAHHKMSERYQFIPTFNVVEAMRREGFVPVRASQSVVRIADRKDFTKHMIRFRLSQDLNALDRFHDGKEVDVLEIVMTNGHDGTSIYNLCAGIFRNICSNGLVAKSAHLNEIRVRHFGKNVVQDVIEGSYRIIEDAPKVVGLIDSMKAKPIDERHQQLYAAAAAVARYGVDERGNLQSSITPRQLLIPRRREDTAVRGEAMGIRQFGNASMLPKPDVWHTFNVVQENLMKGGISARNAKGRRSSTRAVNSVNETLRMNRTLWELAEDLLTKQVA